MRALPLLLFAATSCGKEEGGGSLMDLRVDGAVVATLDAEAEGGAIAAWTESAELRDGMVVELRSRPNAEGQVFSYAFELRERDGGWALCLAGTDDALGGAETLEAFRPVLRGELESWVGVHRDPLPASAPSRR